jgi:hypothetical protein
LDLGVTALAHLSIGMRGIILLVTEEQKPKYLDEKRMRGFRVTTVFEGTIEIHSIYPALYLMRDIM